MKYLNFSNAEELVFYDRRLQEALPQHMFPFFEQWRLAQSISFLRDLGKQAILDFLNVLTPEDGEVLESYFGEKIVVEKLNYNIVQNVTFPVGEEAICEILCKIEGYNYFTLWRDETNLYATFWR